MSLKEYYIKKLNDAIIGNKRVQKNILHISLLRIFIFIAGFIALCLGYDQGGSVIGGILLAILIPFLLLVKLHNHLFHLKDWHETSIRHYQAELASLENDNSAFDGGKEWMDASHPFSLDLDVFGDSSVFQMLNRTSTPLGKETLSHWLRQPLDNKKASEERQQAIKEFSTYNDFDTSLDLNKDPRRIDYIYYRDATPLNYVCNDATYEGCYASDHLPVYSDMKIKAVAK